MKSSTDPQLLPKQIHNALSHFLDPCSVLKADSTPFTQVITDSRKVQPGVLFVALPGEKFDGHQFIAQVLKQGASGILCTAQFLKENATLTSQFPAHFFAVNSIQDAYRHLGGWWRKQFKIPVIVVAGSAGKTTTKEFLAAILTGAYPLVLKTQASQNGFLGIPMTLLEMRAQHRAAIIEVGIDEIGAMIQHLQLVRPTHAVLTSVGPEHLDKLRDLPTVASEEILALLYTGGEGGHISINLDDPWIKKCLPATEGMKRSFFTLEAHTTLLDSYPTEEKNILYGTLTQEGQQLLFISGNERLGAVQLPLPGKHNAQNLLAAVSIAKQLGLSYPEIQSGLSQFEGAEGRSQVKELTLSSGAKVKVLCDYYNAQPVSVAAGLELLTQLSSNTSATYAALGDMLELGTQEETLHRELAPKIVALGISNLLLFGKRMTWLKDELQKLGFTKNLTHFDSQQLLAESLKNQLKQGDVLLIKGSRSMKMETIWNELNKPT